MPHCSALCTHLSGSEWISHLPWVLLFFTRDIKVGPPWFSRQFSLLSSAPPSWHSPQLLHPPFLFPQLPSTIVFPLLQHWPVSWPLSLMQSMSLSKLMATNPCFFPLSCNGPTLLCPRIRKPSIVNIHVKDEVVSVDQLLPAFLPPDPTVDDLHPVMTRSRHDIWPQLCYLWMGEPCSCLLTPTSMSFSPYLLTLHVMPISFLLV